MGPHSSANPWELPLAFDRSVASRWCSGQSVRSGMFLEVDFPQPVDADEVELVASALQGSVALEIQIGRANQWTVLPSREQSSQMPASPLYRRMVTREMLANGVNWLVLRREDYGAADVLDHPQAWGVTHVAAADGFHLLRIEP
ncbi:MAG: hypothetical protein QM757_40340 [Paludibaculum sp.]